MPCLELFMEPIKVKTNSENATRMLAQKLAEIIKAPLVIALDGDLGAGKTTFVSCLVSSLSPIKKIRVQSPTFALARSYPTNPIVHHLDLYRLDQTSNLADLGLLEFIDDTNAIICVEWASKLPQYFTKETLYIKIKSNAKNLREFEFKSANISLHSALKNLI